jgi:hypothetical protein
MRVARVLLVAAAVAGCDSAAPTPPRVANVRAEPDKIRVVHVLIAFRGARDAAESITRTKEEAETMAKEILARARAGEDIDKLAKEFSSDPGGGTYVLTNHGVPSFGGQKRRAQMVPGFTKVAFSLAVGESEMAPYHPEDTPHGFHIIKRTE